MADLKSVQIDTDDAEDGRWFGWFEDLELKIASMNSVAFKRAMSRVRKPGRKGFRTGSYEAEEAMERDVTRLMSKHVLKGWRNMTIDGEEVPYSEEKAFELLNDEQWPLKKFVLEVAASLDEFIVDDTEVAAGN